MSLSAALFGSNSFIFKATNILGLGIPGMLNKMMSTPGAEPQRLGDISQQTAKEGEARVVVWGRVRPIAGNLIHVQEPIKRMVKVGEVSTGGKGGGKKKKQDQYAEHVFRSYALGVCEGPITGYLRIWRNNKLVYDARGNEWGEKNNGVFLKNYRLYTGDWEQLPDPTLQSIWGDIPAYRSTAYIVAIDEDLTDMGGAVPQWQFEVWREDFLAVLTSEVYEAEEHTSEVYEGEDATSTLYPIEFDDSLAPSAAAPSVREIPVPKGDDAMGIAMLAPSVSRVTAVRYLDYAYEESLGIAMLAPSVSRVTEVRYLTYDNAEPESLEVAMLAPAVSRRNHPVYTIPEESISVAMLAPSVSIEFGVDIWEAPTNLSGVFEDE